MLTVIVYAKTIVIVVIIRICLIPSKLKMTTLMTVYLIKPSKLFYDIVIKSLVLNSTPAIFDNFRIRKKLDGLD